MNAVSAVISTEIDGLEREADVSHVIPRLKGAAVLYSPTRLCCVVLTLLKTKIIVNYV